MLSGLRGAPGYSLEQAHHLPIEMDPLIGEHTFAENPINAAEEHTSVSGPRDRVWLWAQSGKQSVEPQNHGGFSFVQLLTGA